MEWPYLPPPDDQCPDRFLVAEQGDGKDGPMAELPRKRIAFRKFAFGLPEIVDLDRPALGNSAAAHPTRADRPGVGFYRDGSVVGRRRQRFADPQRDDRIISLAEPGGTLGNSAENWLNIGGRGSDGTQD